MPGDPNLTLQRMEAPPPPCHWEKWFQLPWANFGESEDQPC